MNKGFNIVRTLFYMLFSVSFLGVIGYSYYFVCTVALSNKVKIYFLVVYCLMFLSLLFFTTLLFIKEQIKWEKILLITMIIWGVAFALIFPTGSAPDEKPAHFYSANQIPNKILGYEDHGDYYFMEADLMEDGNVADYIITGYTYEKIVNSTFFRRASDERVRVDGLSIHWYKYIPSSIGLLIGRVIKLGHNGYRFLGRMFNLAFFIVCCYFAIKLTPRGKYKVVSFAMIPMMAELAASYSYDAVSNAVAILYIAEILHLADKYPKEGVKWHELIFALVMYLYLMPFKGIYAGFIILFFLIPFNKSSVNEKLTKIKTNLSDNKMKRLVICVSILIIALIVVFVIYRVMRDRLGTIGSLGNMSAGYFIKHPLSMFTILRNTANTLVIQWTLWMFGSALGALNTSMSDLTVFMTAFLIILGFVKCRNQKYEYKYSFIIWLVVISTILLAVFGALLAWTNVDGVTVEGIQGRYFLPALALVMLAFGADNENSDYKLEVKYLYFQNAFLIYGLCFSAIPLTLLRK